MNAQTDIIQRPELTLPQPEAECLRAAYARAETILEYGSGGSTVMAAELGKYVTAVESDKGWAQMMERWFAQNPTPGKAQIIWANIGPTKAWGHPADSSKWKRFSRYPLEIWDMPDLPHPDVVFVDGRFREACALATAFRISRPIPLYFDDYTDRDRFAETADFLGEPAEITGRMARFDLTPQPIPADKLLRITQLMMRP